MALVSAVMMPVVTPSPILLTVAVPLSGLYGDAASGNRRNRAGIAGDVLVDVDVAIVREDGERAPAGDRAGIVQGQQAVGHNRDAARLNGAGIADVGGAAGSVGFDRDAAGYSRTDACLYRARVAGDDDGLAPDGDAVLAIRRDNAAT